MQEYVRGVKSSDSFAVDGLISGDEDSCLQAIVICNGEDRVVSTRHEEFDDEIHSDCLEGESIWFRSNGI